jgi:hypothetical protein
MTNTNEEELARIRKILQNWGSNITLIACIAAAIAIWIWTG